MKLDKYFWHLNPKALKETGMILRNPSHPQFKSRMITLLSRCDNPKELFSVLSKEKFVAAWPKIRRTWSRLGESADFRAWWETIYEQLVSKDSKTRLFGRPAKDLQFLGHILKSARIGLGLSQNDMARKVHMSQPDLSGIERGRKNITLLTLLRCCKVLGIKSIPVSKQDVNYEKS